MAATSSLQQGITHIRAHDPILARVIDSTFETPTFTPHTDYYQTLVDSIISQQLSVKAAASIQRRFNALFGDETVIPSPEQIVTSDVEILRTAGLSRPKATYILDLAQKTIDGTITFDHLESLDNDAIIAELTQVKGIGEWTVHMFLMFCMGRLDILPTGDLGIRNGATKLYGLATTATPTDIKRIAEDNNWQPYQSIASWYTWHSLDNKPMS
ncbi:MAG TPA: DNA-3-methyladenine glycosylase [Candidatus Saccharibacteria bacterium]|nr:DNA-3-methyladenine glycosylase [Candidatus Saccharibacteria bacterium]